MKRNFRPASLLPQHRRLTKKLREKIRESLSSVLPITLLILLLSLLFAPVPLDTMGLFLLGAALMILGMGFFTLGADMAMLPMGEQMGVSLTRRRSVWFLAGFAFLLGVLITVAEPDLTVLANQVQGVPNPVLILSVAVGVGLFLAAALLRILFRLPLKYILMGLYALVFLLGIFIKPEFLPMAFDAGGVTTGPMTVPFILALGMGIANVRGGDRAQDDSFGLVALCSVGPILAVMLVSLFFPHLANTPAAEPAAAAAETTRDLMRVMGRSLPAYLKEALIALLPIVALFAGFQVFMLHLPGSEIRRIAVGVLYTYIGLTVFLTGVNTGFLPMGGFLGRQIAASPFRWAMIPLGMMMGYLAVAAEPAVHVLNSQVEQMTAGAIRRSVMMKALSIGVAVSVGLSMVRVLTGVSVWYFILPGYLIALLLALFTPPVFTAIAFDSGGVASGPMTAAFMLPLATGACGAVGGNILQDAFGLVAMVAMTPLIAIECLGVVYRVKTGRKAPEPPEAAGDDEIIDV